MNNSEGPWTDPQGRIGEPEPSAHRLDECDGGEDFVFRQWDHPDDAQQLCEQTLLQHPGLEERQLWRELAAHRSPAVLSWNSCPSVPMFLAYPPKLRDRVRLLIGRLPEESLRDFDALVTLTQTFLARMEAICDLLVYLYAEREKGSVSEGTPASLYVDFFAQKLNWELEELQHISQRHSLSEIPGQYVDWLTDRILDGEVLI